MPKVPAVHQPFAGAFHTWDLVRLGNVLITQFADKKTKAQRLEATCPGTALLQPETVFESLP